ncbi:MAG: hypothetical protein ACREE6_12635, partial [Limisphaerales bacterium]
MRNKTGQVVKKSFTKEDVDRAGTAAAQRPLAESITHSIEVVVVSVAGLEPTTKHGFTLEIWMSGVPDTSLTQTMAKT